MDLLVTNNFESFEEKNMDLTPVVGLMQCKMAIVLKVYHIPCTQRAQP
jgi:hypothetical protein